MIEHGLGIDAAQDNPHDQAERRYQPPAEPYRSHCLDFCRDQFTDRHGTHRLEGRQRQPARGDVPTDHQPQYRRPDGEQKQQNRDVSRIKLEGRTAVARQEYGVQTQDEEHHQSKPAQCQASVAPALDPVLRRGRRREISRA